MFWGVLGECHSGGRGVPEEESFGVQEVWGGTHLCTSLEELGAGWDPWVSFTVCLGVIL